MEKAFSIVEIIVKERCYKSLFVFFFALYFAIFILSILFIPEFFSEDLISTLIIVLLLCLLIGLFAAASWRYATRIARKNLESFRSKFR